MKTMTTLPSSLASTESSALTSSPSPQVEEPFVEPMLKENPQRFVLFPIQDEVAWGLYKDAIDSFWTAEEVPYSDDVLHWNDDKKISKDCRHFIKHILAFFASADGIVNENLASRFYNEVQVPEYRCFYSYQMFIESVHSEVYSMFVDSYISDKEEKDQIFNAMTTIPAIKKMADWAIRWLQSDQPFCVRLIAFACVEGILFSAPFCAIFWLKKEGLLPGLAFANELISRDEGMHADFACYLNSKLERPASTEIITQIVKEATDLEIEFARDAIPPSLIGMNMNLMIQYVEFVADRMLVMLKCPKLYNVSCPFDWMMMISIENKTEFFSRRVSEYGRAGSSKSSRQSKKQNQGGLTKSDPEHELLADF